MKRILTWAAVGVLLFGVSARADEALLPPPAAALRLSSFHDFLEDVKFVVAANQGEAAAQQLDNLITGSLGEKYGGIDTKRPLGAYAWFGANPMDVRLLLLIPIADEPAFKGLLERFLGKAQPAPKGGQKLGDFYLNFVERYAYVSHHETAASRFPEPAKLLAPRPQGSLSLTFDLPRIPANVQAGLLPRPAPADPAETNLQRRLGQQVSRSMETWLAQIAKEGNEAVLQFGVERKTDEIFGKLNLSAKPDTGLAKQVTEFGQARSRFARFTSLSGAAAHLVLHWQLPNDLSDALRPAIDESLRRAMQNAGSETVRKHSVSVVEALQPTLRGGELDAASSLRGPTKDGLYSVVLGIKLKDGNKLDAALRDLIRALPARDRDKFKLDTARVQQAPIHRAEVQQDLPAQMQTVFGTQPLYFSLTNDATWVAVGPEALETLKLAVAMPVEPGPQVSLELSFARLPILLAKDKTDVPVFVKASEEVFGKAPAKDKLRVLITGGEAFTARVTVDASVHKFLHRIGDRLRGHWLFNWY